jgi:hypothetical protein
MGFTSSKGANKLIHDSLATADYKVTPDLVKQLHQNLPNMVKGDLNLKKLKR